MQSSSAPPSTDVALLTGGRYSLAELSLAALRALAIRLNAHDWTPSAGRLVEVRTSADAPPRRYIRYTCVVCGKQSGDLSRHRKHERACKKKVLRHEERAELRELRRQRRQLTADASPLESAPVPPLQSPSGTEGLSGGASFSLVKETALLPPLLPPLQKKGRKKASLRAADIVLAAGERPLTATEWSSLLQREFKAVVNDADAAPATCLLSRNSVLARIDLEDVFLSTDTWSLFSAEDIHHLCSFLPDSDQRALQQRPAAPMEAADDSGSQRSQLPSPSAVTPSASAASPATAPVSPLPSDRTAAELEVLGATMRDRSFRRTLSEYRALLRTGSLDPALKSLRLMAEGRRRREERLSRSWKAQHFERYWGEALSEEKVGTANGRGKAAARKRSRKASDPPGAQVHGEWRDRGLVAASRRSNGGRQSMGSEGEASQLRSAPSEEALDSEATQSDEAYHDSGGIDEAGGSEEEEPASPVSPSTPLSPVSTASDDEPRLHRRYRRSRTRRSASMGEGEAEKRRSGARSPSPHSTLRPPSAELPLPAPQVSLPLPSSYPILQRFHFRSPRFRHIKRAVFVLRAPGVSTAGRATRPSSPASQSPRPRKRRASRAERSSHSSSTQLAFSHLPPAVARECAELRERVWTEGEKAEARERIAAANSARVKRAEMDRLDRALRAETRLLSLMEDRGEKRAAHRRRRDEGERGGALSADGLTRSLLTLRVKAEDGFSLSEDEAEASSSASFALPSTPPEAGASASAMELLASAATAAAPPRLHSMDLRRRVFSPPSSACEEAFSSFVLDVRQGPLL